MVYKFGYDAFGRTTNVSVGNGSAFRTLSTSEYDGNLLLKETLGNGFTVNYEYDPLDRLELKYYNGDRSKYVEYLYDPNGNQYGVADSIWGKGTYLEFDLSGRTTGISTVDLSTKITRAYESIRYNDGKNTVEGVTQTLFNASGEKVKTLVYEYVYGDEAKGEMPDALYKFTMGSRTFAYGYDSLGRLTDKTVHLVGKTATESYTYKANKNDSAFTTPVVETLTDYTGVTHTYTYDANGNITKEVVGNQTVEYVYDSQNRLVEYYNPIANVTEVYTYDARGNILKVGRNSYLTPAELAEYGKDSLTGTTYTYGDDTWADLLTKIGSTTITYDEIGNPLNWIWGETLTWQNGKQLASYNGTVNYSYSADGLRVAKSGAKNTEYYIINGQYIGESTTIGDTTYLISYFYDENGAPAGIYVNDAVYYFVKNLQGDVTALLDYTGTVVAKYTYDAYGYLLSVTNANGNDITSATHVANLNPFRYRGYMYDEESGFYYLRSRYYDPYIGRCLNTDTTDILTATPNELTDKNLFAYCDNNPVVRSDHGGEFWNIIAGAVIGSAISTVSQIAVNVATGNKWSSGVGMAAVTGALSGGLAATGLGKVGQVVGNAIISGASEIYNQYKNYKNNNGDFSWGTATASVAAATGLGALSGLIGGEGARAKGSNYKNALNNLNSVKEKIASTIYSNASTPAKLLSRAKGFVRAAGQSVTKITSFRFFAGAQVSQYGMACINAAISK